MDERVALRIGELAELAGVTTRAIRHYHRIGLLPEPDRASNGYRCYEMRDAVLLLRVRRLIDLGLNLDEVSDALAESDGRDLREILADLDADLATEEDRIAARRKRIAVLLAKADELTGSAEKDAVVAQLEGLAGADHPGLARERLSADLVDALVDPVAVPLVWETYRRFLADTGVADGMLSAAARFEELVGLDPDDPAVDALAAEAEGLGGAVLAMLPPEVRELPGDPDAADRLLRAVTTGMDPAQVQCMALMFDRWREQSS